MKSRRDLDSTGVQPEHPTSGVEPSHLRITYRDIEELRPDPRNPRKHSRGQIKKLARSIEKHHCIVPLLLDRNGNLIAGHARYQACKLLGLTEIPTICLNHLDQHQARAFMLADNRLAELAEWDGPLLAEHLKELSEVLNFEIELTGFEMGEIDYESQGLNRYPIRRKTRGTSCRLSDLRSLKRATFGCSIDIGLCAQARSKSLRTHAYLRNLTRRW
jgi:hypothetical protein